MRLCASGLLICLAACASVAPPHPPAAGTDTPLAAEQRLFEAFAAKDRSALAGLLAPEFLLRSPGQADLDARAVIASALAVPGRILWVRGEDLRVREQGDRAWVTGIQRSELLLDGKRVVARAAFCDEFVRIGGRWRATFAFNVEVR